MLLNILIGSASIVSIALIATRIFKEFCDNDNSIGVAAQKNPVDNVNAVKVAADKVTTNKVTTDKVTTDKVSTNKIATDKVITDKVTAEKVIAEKKVARHPMHRVAVFDGQSQYIEIPASFPDITNQVTIEFWAKGGAGLPQASTVFGAHDGAGQRVFNIHLPWHNGKLYWDSGNIGARFDRAQKAATPQDYKDAWVHWAFIKNVDRGFMRIYKNGVLWHQGRQKKRVLNGKSIRTVTIGAFGDGSGHYKWSGALAELRVWNRVLKPAEILAGMGIRATGLTKNDGLVAYWPLNEPLTPDSGVKINNVSFADATDLPLET